MERDVEPVPPTLSSVLEMGKHLLNCDQNIVANKFFSSPICETLSQIIAEGVGKKSLSVNGGGHQFNVEDMMTSALASNPKILYAPNETDARIIIDEVQIVF